MVGTDTTSCTANAIPRYDSTSARKIKSSGVTIDDNNLISAVGGFYSTNGDIITDTGDISAQEGIATFGSVKTNYLTSQETEENLIIGNSVMKIENAIKGAYLNIGTLTSPI